MLNEKLTVIHSIILKHTENITFALKNIRFLLTLRL